MELDNNRAAVIVRNMQILNGIATVTLNWASKATEGLTAEVAMEQIMNILTEKR